MATPPGHEAGLARECDRQHREEGHRRAGDREEVEQGDGEELGALLMHISGISSACAIRGSPASFGQLLELDVRTTKEWNAGHLEGAVHIPLGDLARRAAEIPRDRPVATMCEAGDRSSLAASVLSRSGVDGVVNVTGVMSVWRALAPAPVASRQSPSNTRISPTVTDRTVNTRWAGGHPGPRI